ncbi:MAG: VIT1/CCC1 transporter family protein [Desulfobacterales bacterium]
MGDKKRTVELGNEGNDIGTPPPEKKNTGLNRAGTRKQGKIRKQILKYQKSQITEHHIYSRLSKKAREPSRRNALKSLAEDELTHYRILMRQTKVDIRPSRLKILAYLLSARIFGLQFTLRLMEYSEEMAEKTFREITHDFPEAEAVRRVERRERGHDETLNGIDETRLQYAGSVVLGLNDALVELTGAIAGYTLALQNTQMIAVISLITGISASLSMAGSEYLSIRTEEGSVKNPVRASFYTGTAYLFATMILVAPFFILAHHLAALGWTLANALLLIFLFTFYISFAKGYRFKRRFAEMMLISLGVAAVSFVIGFLARRYFDMGM